MNTNLIGICGLYCGACDNYKAFTDEGAHLLETPKFKNQNHSLLKCSGCNSDQLSEHCSHCNIRKCAQSKSYLYCGQCPSFPCSLINSFISDGKGLAGAKHRMDIISNMEQLQQTNPQVWLDKNQESWTCKCGHSYTFYESSCNNCSSSLNSYNLHNTLNA